MKSKRYGVGPYQQTNLQILVVHQAI